MYQSLEQSTAQGLNEGTQRKIWLQQDLFLVQHVTEATRFRQGQKASVLDYILTDEDNVIDYIQYEESLGRSDHCCLTWVITVSKA